MNNEKTTIFTSNININSFAEDAFNYASAKNDSVDLKRLIERVRNLSEETIVKGENLRKK